MSADRPPLPPFTRQTALVKVQAAEDAWNSRDPERVALAYSEDSVWRNRDAFLTGRAEIVAFLTAKWQRELDYALRKSLSAFEGDRIAVRFQYECHDDAVLWYRCYGNEPWEFDAHGPMPAARRASTTFGSTRANALSSTPLRRAEGSRPAAPLGGAAPVAMACDVRPAAGAGRCCC